MNNAISNGNLANAGTVLIVDDEEKNRMLLRDSLEVRGYQAVEAASGEEALKRYPESQADVILLDLMMPGIDGIEVCKRIRSSPGGVKTPILILTALTDRPARLRGIEAGANDFLTKPIDLPDVLLRVRNAVITKRLFDQVEDSLKRLQHSEKLREDLTQMIIHDLRSPLTALMGFIELVKMNLEENLNDKDIQYLTTAYDSATGLSRLITSILDVSKLEAGEMTLQKDSTNLHRLIETACDSLKSLTGPRRMIMNFPVEPTIAVCDQDIVARVLTNLLSNAVKYTREDGEIRITVAKEGAFVSIAITDDGAGIPKEYHERIFEKFGQVEGRRKSNSTGLGLTFCRLAVESSGGTIGVESEPGKGSSFKFTLPL